MKRKWLLLALIPVVLIAGCVEEENIEPTSECIVRQEICNSNELCKLVWGDYNYNAVYDIAEQNETYVEMILNKYYEIMGNCSTQCIKNEDCPIPENCTGVVANCEPRVIKHRGIFTYWEIETYWKECKYYGYCH